MKIIDKNVLAFAYSLKTLLFIKRKTTNSTITNKYFVQNKP